MLCLSSASLSLFHCIPTVGPHPTFRPVLSGRLPVLHSRRSSKTTLSPLHFTSCPNPYPVSTIFSLSNPCLGVCPLNESPTRRCASRDVHNHKTRDACLPTDRFCIHVDSLILLQFPLCFIRLPFFCLCFLLFVPVQKHLTGSFPFLVSRYAANSVKGTLFRK